MRGAATIVPRLRFKEFGGEWEARRIGDFSDVKTGGCDTQDRVDDGAYPFFVRSDTIERINSYSFDGEAILTSGDGVGVGKNVHYINGRFDYHQRVYAIRDFSKDVDGQFFFQFFRENFLPRVMRLSAKNSVDSVRMSMITDMLMATPTLPEQKKIAAFLGVVDAKLAALRARILGLQGYKRGLMQALFSQTLRFTQKDGTAFPDWEEKRLGDHLELLRERVPASTDIPVYSSSRDGLKAQKDYFADRELANEGEYGVVPHGYLTYRHMSDDLTFKFNLNKLGFNVAVSKEYPVFQTKGMDICFLLYWLNESAEFARFAIMQKMGGTRTRLYFKTLADWELYLPHPVEQAKIAEALSAMDAKIAAVQDQISKMQDLKKGLLQQMFV